jgi:hypothetical protein
MKILTIYQISYLNSPPPLISFIPSPQFLEQFQQASFLHLQTCVYIICIIFILLPLSLLPPPMPTPPMPNPASPDRTCSDLKTLHFYILNPQRLLALYWLSWQLIQEWLRTQDWLWFELIFLNTDLLSRKYKLHSILQRKAKGKNGGTSSQTLERREFWMWIKIVGQITLRSVWTEDQSETYALSR